MERIDDLQTKKEIIKTLYYGNYIEELETRDNSYFKKVINSYILFKTSDNFIIVYRVESPSIQKTLWFDDELPIPNLTEELFLSYNLKYFRTIKSEYQDKTFIYNAYYKSENPYNCVICSQYGYFDKVEDKTFKRWLTEEEEETILSIDEEIKQNFIKRLKNYYKRYKEHIYCQGYWVNR